MWDVYDWVLEKADEMGFIPSALFWGFFWYVTHYRRTLYGYFSHAFVHLFCFVNFREHIAKPSQQSNPQGLRGRPTNATRITIYPRLVSSNHMRLTSLEVA